MGLKLVKSILKEANVDDNVVTRFEKHPARVPGKGGIERPLKTFTKSKDHRL